VETGQGNWEECAPGRPSFLGKGYLGATPRLLSVVLAEHGRYPDLVRLPPPRIPSPLDDAVRHQKSYLPARRPIATRVCERVPTYSQ